MWGNCDEMLHILLTASHLQSLAGAPLQISPSSQVSSQALGVNSVWVTCS